MFADRVTPWTDRLTVTIKPTWLCNLSCRYCYQGRALPARNKAIMSPEVLEAAIRQTSRLPIETVDLQWIGGETLAPGVAFFQRAIEATDRHAVPGGATLKHWFQTNLTMIDDNWLAFFAANQDRIVLSASYDFFEDYFLTTQQRGDRARHQWTKVRNGLKLLQDAGIEFGCLTTIDRTALTIPAAQWFTRWLEDDVRRVGLQLDYADVYSHAESAGAGDPWRPYIAFLDELFTLQAAHNRAHPDHPVLLRESIYLYNTLTGVRSDDWTGSCHHSAALCGQFFWTIDVDGAVYGMCDAFMTEPVAASYRLGNVLSDDLAAIKDSEVFAELTDRQFRLKHDLSCQACGAWAYCRGGCPAFKSAHNRLETFNPASIYCSYTRALFDRFLLGGDLQRITAIYAPTPRRQLSALGKMRTT